MNAYEKIRDALLNAMGSCIDCDKDCGHCLDLKSSWIPEAKAALAEPRRNCDVGTAEEQDERFSGYCAKFIGGTCTGCPLWKFQECGIGWAQMPYEEGGEGCPEAITR